MRIQTKRTLQVALVSGGLLMVGIGSSASEAATVTPDVPVSPLDQLVANGAADDLQAAQSLQQPATGVYPRHPAAVLHTVPTHLLQYAPAPSAEISGDLPEEDLNAPLGSELAATDLPVLPFTVPPTATAATELDRTTVSPVDGQLPVLPLHGSVATQPLDPGAGTRVTGLRTSAARTGAVQPPAPALPAAMPTYDPRAAALPLLGGLLPILPMRAPALNGVQPTSLTGLSQLAGSTPLTRSGRPNAGAVTAPLNQHGPGALESAAALLRR